MKKTLLTCLAVVALFAIASSATAITCTIDQRPAATLLVPYFQVSIDPATGGTIGSGELSRDTIVTIGNASSAPMIAHVNVYDRVLDARPRLQRRPHGLRHPVDGACPTILTGHLPVTLQQRRATTSASALGRRRLPEPGRLPARFADRPDQRSGDDPGQHQRHDELLGSVRSASIVDAPARRTATANVEPLAHRLHRRSTTPTTATSPTRPIANYYINDAIGMENNLFGEIIFTSGHGLPTYGISTVEPRGGHDPRRGHGARAAGVAVARTFYARYWIRSARRSAPTAASGDPDTDLSISRSLGRGLRRPARAPRPALGRPLVRPRPRASSRPTSCVWRGSDARSTATATVDEPLVDPDVLRRGREHGDARVFAPRRARTRSSTSRTRRSSATSRTSSTRSADAGWVQIDFDRAARRSTRPGSTTRSSARSLSSRS